MFSLTNLIAFIPELRDDQIKKQEVLNRLGWRAAMKQSCASVYMQANPTNVRPQNVPAGEIST
jgi:hypothetical protein